MAKKRKSRQKKTAAGRIDTLQSGNPVSASLPQQNRYGGKFLTLAIMGGAAFSASKAVVMRGVRITMAMVFITLR